MNLLSKYICIIGVSTIFFMPSSFSQDTLIQIKHSWINLKWQIQKRNELASHFVSLLEKTKKPDKKLIQQIKNHSASFNSFIKPLTTPDVGALIAVEKKYDTLTASLSKAVNTVMQDAKFKKSTDFYKLISQLESAENRIIISSQDFNDTCEKYSRSDLSFKVKQEGSVLK